MKDCKHTKTYNTFENGKMVIHCMYCPKILNEQKEGTKKSLTKKKLNVPKILDLKIKEDAKTKTKRIISPIRKNSRKNRRRSTRESSD